MTPVVEMQNVCFAYGNETILDDVSLTIQQGDFASIVGPNGGGKTTLVRLALGLLRPVRGSVRLFGDACERTRGRVGYSPQHPAIDLAFPVCVYDVVRMGRMNHRGTTSATSLLSKLLVPRCTKADRLAIDKAMTQMQINDIAGKPLGDLSGGQRQRVFLARALAAEPDLLIFDEPTNNVDPGGSELLYELLLKLNKEITIVIVSHDLGVVSHYVKSVICVNRRVVVHPTSALDGTMIREIYGSDVRLIRHDHRCSEQGHYHISQ
ncbi:MAG: metal ABC transporter ATP-binding protein [Planctomycetia bacterium]|nr:metal ABC transporter ATP-binding protein [Planctomycetia bacterium]